MRGTIVVGAVVSRCGDEQVAVGVGVIDCVFHALRDYAAAPGVGRQFASESGRQCGRGVFIALDEPQSLEAALRDAPADATRLILDPSGGSVRDIFTCGPPPSVVLAVGPEGGFTDGELALAEILGFRRAGLGRLILRVETAAIAAAVLSVAFVGGLD